MATEQAARHRRQKISSAPSSPQNLHIAPGKQDSADVGEEAPLVLQKQTPHYLKPTISSAGHDICTHANKQPSSPAPVAAAKRLLRTKSIPSQPQRPSSPAPAAAAKWLLRTRSISSHPQKSPCASNITIHKEKSNANSSTPLASRPAVSPQQVPCSVKTTPVKVDNPKEKVVSVDVGSIMKLKEEDEHSTMVTKDDDSDSDSNSNSNRGDGGGLRRLKFRERRKEGEAGRESVTLKKLQDIGKGKESPAASNQVIEEAASKLIAGQRISKVAALVGAFETVISLHEAVETGQTQQQDAVTAAMEEANGGESVQLGRLRMAAVA